MRNLPTLRRFVYGALALVGDAIESVGSGEYREDLQARLRACAERGAELALENSRLREKVDRQRFNGPTLWADEVAVLEEYVNSQNLVVATELCQDVEFERRKMEVVLGLLDRCDHLPMTRKQLDEQCGKVLADGAIPVMWEGSDSDDDVTLWNDPGRDVDG